MDEGIKRKLVGVAVLVVAAIVVLPLITPKTQNAEYLSKSVPVELDVPAMEMPLPKSMSLPTREHEDSGLIESVKLDAQTVDTKKRSGAQFEIPKLDASGQTLVWQIQVASFAKPKNALALRDRLRKAGYKAFEKQSKDGEYVRVFIGPSSQQNNLKRQLKEIKSRYKLDGKIIPYVGQ